MGTDPSRKPKNVDVNQFSFATVAVENDQLNALPQADIIVTIDYHKSAGQGVLGDSTE